MHNLSIATFQHTLIDWYKLHGRTLPWRQTTDPYAILVSEIMLQQTQVERVLPKYKEFLRLFPTVKALARAPKADVLRVWSGLGYNSRALRLQKTAQYLYEQYGGIFPQTREELQSLPGIGPYTSGAIMAFAFHLPVSFVDTNIKRVIHRIFLGLEFQGWKKTDREIDQLCDVVCAKEESFAYHQALMDLGSSYCTAKKLQCIECPLRDICNTARLITEDSTLLNSPRISYKRSSISFKESKRYIRGGIIEKLRNIQYITERDLYLYVCEVLRPMEREEFSMILSALEKEGLITVREGVIELGG